jgi:hypothetical protein
MSQVKKFCRCIKAVRNTVKLRRGKGNKESAAIAICTKAILQSRGRTMKKFRCRGKPYLKTQVAKAS